MAMKISELAQLVDGEVVGNGETLIDSLSSIESAIESQLVFIADPARNPSLDNCNAGCLVVPERISLRPGQSAIVVEDPKLAFARIGEVLHPRPAREPEIHESAVIDVTAGVAEGVFIGAFCTVGEGSAVGAGTQIFSGAKIGDRVEIGKKCVIHSNVVVEDDSVIGDNVVIKSGAVIGSRGFGFVRGPKGLVKFPQIGRTVIESDVEIGANSCIDRGALGETRIGRGSKIDNLVQVAHNVAIGENTVIAALSGVSGSAEIGSDCIVGGQVGFADHTKIDDGVIVGAKSAVFPGKHLRSGVWAGIPVRPIKDYKRLNAHLGSLGAIRAELKNLKRIVMRLEHGRVSGDEN